MNDKNLYRSISDSKVAGVCGGLGKYLNIDPIVFRILFVLTFFVGGSGFLIYIILWIVLPLESEPKINTYNINNENMTEENKNAETGYQQSEKSGQPQKNDGSGNLWGGLILIAIGVIFLIIRFVPRIDFSDLWPVLLIVLGVVLIAKSYQQPKK